MIGLPKNYVAPSMEFPKFFVPFLRKKYQDAKCILEYGSGGSTVLAASQPILDRKQLISIESDRNWAKNLQIFINWRFPFRNVKIIHADIGPTAAWGYPHSKEFRDMFPNYPRTPWLYQPDLQPDLVLIDGRFRIACFVETLKNLKAPCTILFDDYQSREYYHVIEDLVVPEKVKGRIAVFNVDPKKIDRERLYQFEDYYYETK
ncbi:MAG: hypothetical protein AAF198_12460 [Pseudomonadota bacterium]